MSVVEYDTLNITPSKRRTLLANWIVVEAGYIANCSNVWAKCGIYELIMKQIPKSKVINFVRLALSCYVKYRPIPFQLTFST